MWALYNKNYRLITLSLILLFGSSIAKSQTFQHRQYWLDFNPTINLTNKLKLTTEIGYRTEPDISIKQTYFRGFLKIKVHENICLSIGGAEFVSWREHTFRNTELRLAQYITVTWPNIGGFKFKHRFGMNERWFGYSEAQTKFVSRARYRIGLYSPTFGLLNSARRFYSSASIEILRNVNDKELAQWFDHDWVTIIVGGKINKKIGVEGHLLLINRNAPENYNFSREVSAFRLRLFYNIG